MFWLVVEDTLPITGGWLNEKWKVSAEGKTYLVKKYSTKRYNREKLKSVEQALGWQGIARRQGVLCPLVYTSQTTAIRYPDAQTAYCLMEFCNGKPETAVAMNEEAVHSLGDACGHIHRVFSHISTSGQPFDGGNTLRELWENYCSRKQSFSSENPDGYQNAVLKQEAILKWFTPAFFQSIPKGIAHEDFAADNILFEGERVSAVLDLDRCRYSFLWHDIGRAILSYCLNGKEFSRPLLRAFVKGYSRYMELREDDIINCLRLLWCYEVTWWVCPERFEGERNKTTRFREELVWLTDNWFALDSLL